MNIEQLIEMVVRQHGYDLLTDDDWDTLLSHMPPVEVSPDLKQRALAAMERAQIERGLREPNTHENFHKRLGKKQD